MVEKIPINIIPLNTMDDPRRGYRDETPRIRCGRCGHLFLLGRGMDIERDIETITMKHIELCEGDAAVTLMKVEQWWKKSSAGEVSDGSSD